MLVATSRRKIMKFDYLKRYSWGPQIPLFDKNIDDVIKSIKYNPEKGVQLLEPDPRDPYYAKFFLDPEKYSLDLKMVSNKFVEFIVRILVETNLKTLDIYSNFHTKPVFKVF